SGRTYREWIAEGSPNSSPPLQKTKVYVATGLDCWVERLVACRGIQGDATGGCGALHRQPAADAPFHCATQCPTAKASHLPHYRLSSGMPHRRARKQRSHSWLAAAPHALLATPRW